MPWRRELGATLFSRLGRRRRVRIASRRGILRGGTRTWSRWGLGCGHRLIAVAKPEIHLIRGLDIPTPAREAILAKNVPAVFGDLLFGNVKDDYTRPDPQTAINVTAKWTCKPGDESHLEELMFHLSKGTAEKYKKDIDKIAEPERYFFRGPVSCTIRTYSKFLHLPATYSSQGSNFTQPGGTMSEGTTA
jgi:hypothetical protein